MPPLKPEEVWKVMKEQAAEDERWEKELEAVSKMSEAELDKELATAGIDVGHVEKLARNVHERANPLRRRTIVAIAAATAAAVGAAVAAPTAMLVAQSTAPTPAATTTPSEGRRTTKPPPPPPADVASIRRDALTACDEGRWLDCLAGLNLARAKDPAGDGEPAVVTARHEATAGLALILKASDDGGPPPSNAKLGTDGSTGH